MRGDMGAPGVPFTPHPEGYASAAELVSGLKAIAPFEISVAAYPETHPDALSPQDDIDNLKRKLDAGATRAITQMYFENSDYFRFVDRAVRRHFQPQRKYMPRAGQLRAGLDVQLIHTTNCQVVQNSTQINLPL